MASNPKSLTRPVQYASVFAHGDKFVVSAGALHVGTYKEYCIAAEECAAFNRKRAGKAPMELLRQRGGKHAA